MQPRLGVKLVPICFLGLVFPAFAQFNASEFANSLRAKFGQPLHREVFKVRVGEMVVDFAQNGHVCRIQLPPRGPDSHQAGVESYEGVDDFVLELVPMVIRGKELLRMVTRSGTLSWSAIEYQNFIISESYQLQERISVTVAFKNETCQ